VRGEFAENVYHKPFLPSEIASIMREIEPIEKAAARERMTLGKFSLGSDAGRVRDKIGALAGISGRQVEKINQVIEAAEQEPTRFGHLVEEMDRTGNVTRAHLAVQLQRKDEERTDKFHRLIDIDSRLHVGDFRKLAHCIPDNSVELVFTDPPWDRDSVPLYCDAAKEAARILKPGGSMITYVGQVILPDVLPLMMQHLKYFWTGAALRDGRLNQIHAYGIENTFMPMLWLVKEYRGDVQTFVRDSVLGVRQKQFHEWQQSQEDAEHFIGGLTSPTGIVVDFFAGGGTTIAAAIRLKRQWTAFEIDEAAIPGIVERIEAAPEPSTRDEVA